MLRALPLETSEAVIDGHGQRHCVNLEIEMTVTRIELERFTAFEHLDFHPSPGVNVLIGANGTGKTHLMKVAYSACHITKTQTPYAEKLVTTFLPSLGALGRLVRRTRKSTSAKLRIETAETSISLEFSNHIKDWKHSKVRAKDKAWQTQKIDSVFVPVKEMLANAPGFRSLFSQREVHFESIYADIIDRAYLPLARGAKLPAQKKLLKKLQESMEGKVTIRGEEFFLCNAQGNLEFTLLAEGLRKLGLLWLLIQNGTLTSGSILFWDEPETNLNPALFQTVVSILMELQRMGVQVFVTTHDYSLLKEFELSTIGGDQIQYHACYRSEQGEGVTLESRDAPFSLENSAIREAMTSLHYRDVRRAFAQ